RRHPCCFPCDQRTRAERRIRLRGTGSPRGLVMQVSVAHHPPNTAVLILRGSLDIDTAPALKANLNRLVERPTPRVVVDLSGLDFCDSMGVGVLVTAHGRAMERGGWVRLAAPSGFLRRLLDTLGLTGYLSLHHDVEAALTE